MWPLQPIGACHFEQSIATVMKREEGGRQGGRPCATNQSGSSDDIERYGKKSDVHMVGHALKRVHPASSRGCGPTRGRTVVFVV